MSIFFLLIANYSYCQLRATEVVSISSKALDGQNILAIRQDKNGFLWLGSQDGLKVYDGTTIRQVGSKNGSKFSINGTAIFNLCEDTLRNSMWVWSSYGGIDAVDINTYQVVFSLATDSKGNSLKDQPIKSGVIHKDILWFASSSGVNAFNLNTRKLMQLRIQFPVEVKNGVLSIQKVIALDTDVLLLLCDDLGIVALDTRSLKMTIAAQEAAITDNARKKLIYWNASTTGDKILLATNLGLKTILRTAGNHYQPVENYNRFWFGKEEITSCYTDGNHFTLFGNYKGLFRINETNHEVVAVKGGAPGTAFGFISALVKDDHGFIWIGAQNGLGYVSTGCSPFRSFLTSASLFQKKHHVYTLLPVTADSVFVGTDDGLYVKPQQSDSLTMLKEGNLYSLIFKLRDSSLLISYSSGLLHYRRKVFHNALSHFPELDSITGDILTNAVAVNDSLILLGSGQQHGVYIWNTSAHSVKRFRHPGLTNNVVKGLHVLGPDEVIVISETSLLRFHPLTGQIEVKRLYQRKNALPQGILMDLCRLGDNYWLPAYGTGLIMTDLGFRPLRVFAAEDGLSNVGVYKVFPIGDSSLYITSNDGLFRLNTRTFQFRRYNQSDGLHSNIFEENCGAFYGSKIFAGGYNGYSTLDPVRFKVNTIPPRVYINRVNIDRPGNDGDIDTTNLSLAELQVPNDVLQLKLYFSGINYSNPERTTFAYRIRENDTNWIENGADNSVSLIGLAPGSYHVEVKAANEDDYWSKPCKLTLIYLPKWYQTWWFRLLIALSIMGAAYGFYRLRIDQILKQQKIRREVASDLHDDIGSSLNSVKVFAHLASADPSRKEYIRNVEENLEQATIGLRDMIWILDDKLDSVSDLCQRLDQLSARPAEALGISVHFKIEDGLQGRILSKPVKRNLFLIGKEAINNSVKYAGCNNIWISFELPQKKLTMIICDDGKGFDTGLASAGYGLSNMKHRAVQIRYHCNITSDRSGTRTKVTEK